MSSNVGGLRPTRCIPQVTEFLAGYPSPSSFSYYSRSDVCALQCFPPSAVPSSLPLQSSIDAKYIHSRLSSLRHSSVPIASKKPSGAVDKFYVFLASTTLIFKTPVQQRRLSLIHKLIVSQIPKQIPPAPLSYLENIRS